MSVQFQLPARGKNSGNAKEEAFTNDMKDAARLVLSGVWDYTNREAQGVYVYYDFVNRYVDTFVLIDGYLVSPFLLHYVEGHDFVDSDAIRGLFAQQMEINIANFDQMFEKHSKRKPNRAWLGINVTEQENETLIYEYSLPGTPIPPVEEAMQNFVNDVSGGFWPKPSRFWFMMVNEEGVPVDREGNPLPLDENGNIIRQTQPEVESGQPVMQDAEPSGTASVE